LKKKRNKSLPRLRGGIELLTSECELEVLGWGKMIHHSDKIVRAKELRKNAPKTETKFWYAINDNQLGVKFRRQRPIGPYYVDFVCLERNLIIELDGAQHGLGKDAEYDNRRTDCLVSKGYRLIRIPNGYIYKELGAVVEHLRLIINGEIDANDYFKNKYDFSLPKFTPPKSC